MSFAIVVNEVLARVKSTGRAEEISSFLLALKMYEDGIASLQRGNRLEAIQKHEAALQSLERVGGTEKVLAVIRAALASEHAIGGQWKRAVEIGRKAISILGSDHRLAMHHAHCLHDVGGALIQSIYDVEPSVGAANLKDGIALMRQALGICQSLTEGASLAASCRTNLKSVENAL